MPKSGLWCAPCLRSKQPAICRHKVEVVMSCLKLLPLTMAEMPREHQETLPNLKSKCPRKICFTECKRSAKFSFHTPDGVPICSFLIGHYHTAKRPCNRENHADTTESTTSSARPRRSWRVPHEHAKNPTMYHKYRTCRTCPAVHSNVWGVAKGNNNHKGTSTMASTKSWMWT